MLKLDTLPIVKYVQRRKPAGKAGWIFNRILLFNLV